jgi:hypothetical protein
MAILITLPSYRDFSPQSQKIRSARRPSTQPHLHL